MHTLRFTANLSPLLACQHARQRFTRCQRGTGHVHHRRQEAAAAAYQPWSAITKHTESVWYEPKKHGVSLIECLSPRRHATLLQVVASKSQAVVCKPMHGPACAALLVPLVATSWKHVTCIWCVTICCALVETLDLASQTMQLQQPSTYATVGMILSSFRHGL